MNPVLTKQDFVKRYAQGEFGNRPRTWLTYQDWAFDNLGESKLKRFHIRNRVANGPTWFDINKGDMSTVLSRIASQGVSLESLYFTEMVDHTRNCIQGEVVETPTNLHILYSTARGAGANMRAVLPTANHARGVVAVTILREMLPVQDYDWLRHLLDSYPEHVVEFTTLTCEVGVVPGSKTLFWEVRKY